MTNGLIYVYGATHTFTDFLFIYLFIHTIYLWKYGENFLAVTFPCLEMAKATHLASLLFVISIFRHN